MLCKKSLKRYFCRILAYLIFFSTVCDFFKRIFPLYTCVFAFFDREPHIVVPKHL